MTTITPNPRVRVTIEGRPTTHGNGYLRVTTDDGQRLVLDPTDTDVAVEQVRPDIEWRDGDVVQYDAAHRVWTLTRHDGSWTNDNGVPWPEASVTMLVTGEAGELGHAKRDEVRVLRYQAGELTA